MASIRSAVAGTARQEKAGKHKKAPKKAGRAAKKEEQAAKTAQKRAAKNLEKAHTRDSLQALSKLGEVVDGNYLDPSASRRLLSRRGTWPPPTVFPPTRLAT